jgi:hypothetical protein
MHWLILMLKTHTNIICILAQLHANSPPAPRAKTEKGMHNETYCHLYYITVGHFGFKAVNLVIQKINLLYPTTLFEYKKDWQFSQPERTSTLDQEVTTIN